MDSRIWKVIIAVAALHILVLGSMFMIQHGCKRPPADVARPEMAPALPPMAPSAPPPGGVQTQEPVAVAPTPTPAAPTSVEPAPVEPLPPVPEPETTRVYTIKQGDTLGKIAKTEGVSLDSLMAANPGVDPKRLKIGQEIQIPVGGSTDASRTPVAHAVAPALTGTTTPPPAPAVPTSTIYTVKKGDTLSKIARAQGTTVTALKKANRLSSDVIRVGQKLKIPAPQQSGQRPAAESADAGDGSTVISPSGVTHIVQPGETPAIIAKQYGVTTKALLAANGNIDPRKLKVGQKLAIPVRPGEAAPSPTTPAESGAPVDMTAPPETPTGDTGGVSGSAVAPPAPAEPAPAAPAN